MSEMVCSGGECIGGCAVALETSAVNPKVLFGVSSTVHVHGNSTIAFCKRAKLGMPST